MASDLTNLRLDRFASFLLRCHQDEIALSLSLGNSEQIEPQKPESFLIERIHHVGFLPVWLNPKRLKLFLEPLQDPFGPTAFGVVSTDGDHDIIGEPMVVHRLIGAFGGLATDRLKIPVQLVQVDICCQRADYAPNNVAKNDYFQLTPCGLLLETRR